MTTPPSSSSNTQPSPPNSSFLSSYPSPPNSSSSPSPASSIPTSPSPTTTTTTATGFDHLFKIVLVGDSSVGKSNLLSRFTRDVFTADDKSTIGVEFAARILTMKDGRKVKAQIWDTAGQERYRAITTAYYRGALGALLVYDVTKENSLENLPRWQRELKDHSNRDIVMVMIGNKSDISEDDGRQVKTSQAEALAKEMGVTHIEASAKDNVNVSEGFMAVVEKIYENAKLHRGSISNHMMRINTGFNNQFNGNNHSELSDGEESGSSSSSNVKVEGGKPDENAGYCCGYLTAIVGANWIELRFDNLD